jgi:hypothetical protein
MRGGRSTGAHISARSVGAAAAPETDLERDTVLGIAIETDLENDIVPGIAIEIQLGIGDVCRCRPDSERPLSNSCSYSGTDLVMDSPERADYEILLARCSVRHHRRHHIRGRTHRLTLHPPAHCGPDGSTAPAHA